MASLVISLSVQAAINIETVHVGDAGNTKDKTGLGAVLYE